MCADEISKHQKFTSYKQTNSAQTTFGVAFVDQTLTATNFTQSPTSRQIPLEIFVCVDQQLWTTIWNFSFFVELRNLELGTPDPKPPNPKPGTRNPEPCSIYFRQRGVDLHFQRFDRSCCCSSLRSFINKSQKCRAYFIIQVL